MGSNAEPALLLETAMCIKSLCRHYRAVLRLLLLEMIGVQGTLSFVRDIVNVSASFK